MRGGLYKFMTYRPYQAIKSTGIELKYKNDSGVILNKAIPVRAKANGDLDFINVSVEADVFAIVGVTSENILVGSTGGVISAGRIETITTTFAFGDPVYVSKSGGLTNIKPEVGVGGFVGGDFIVRVGTIAKNETNPTLKDLVLELHLVGQLGA